MSRGLAPPGGMAAPTSAITPSRRDLDLLALAKQACGAYHGEFPDELARYGEAGVDWCIHDDQHLLNWATLSLTDLVDFDEQLGWLARVLESRGFPLDRFARNLELLAQTVRTAYPEESDLAARLIGGAEFVRSRGSFL